MANQIILGRALDANGYIAPAARATIYQAGTSTLLTVYSDEPGTIAAANPIIADGNGFWPQRYVAAPAKAVVTDADLATLYTLDPTPISQATASAASLVTFNPTVNIAQTNVQAAIETVDTGWRAASTTTNATKQPLDSDLTAIANLGVSDLGFVIRDGVGVMITHPYASLAEAQAGTATNRVMNPLVTAGTIDPAWTTGSSVAATSGGTVTYSGIPSTATEIVISVTDLSLNGTDNANLRLLDAGTPKTTGYNSVGLFDGTNQIIGLTGFLLRMGAAARTFTGDIILTKDKSRNVWRIGGVCFETSVGISYMNTLGFCTDVVTLSGFNIVAISGTFDGAAGAVIARWR